MIVYHMIKLGLPHFSFYTGKQEIACHVSSVWEHEEGVVQGGIGQAHVHKISYSKVGLGNNSVIEQQKVEEDKYY